MNGDPVRQANEAISRQLALGAPWDACDLFRDAESRHPGDASLLYWGAMAHARAGATSIAHTLLDRAQAMGEADDIVLQESILSLRGRLWKDRVEGAGDQAPAFAAQAYANYRAAYELRQGAFPGINAASMAWLKGDRSSARSLAREVVAQLKSNPAPEDVWYHATLGEAALLQGQARAAQEAYGAALHAARRDVGSVASMRRQLRLLGRELALARELLPQLPTPPVLAFAGHMIDREDRRQPRFPAALEGPVREALVQRLTTMPHPIIYTSAANGADLLLIEVALEAQAEVNVVLPFDRQDFVATSVANAGAAWVARFDAALSRVQRVIMATEEGYLGDDVLFEHAARLVEGLSVLRAAQFGTEPLLLCVMDADRAQVAAPVGGTRASLARWRAHLGEPEIIDLAAMRATLAVPAGSGGERGDADADDADARASASASARLTEPLASANAAPSARSLKTLLFADFAGFSRLHDAYAPLFHARFLELVASQIAAAPTRPLEANTWGDALYVVFETAPQGAEFAWQLLERMRAVDWVAAGLASDSQIRIALHTGPVFCGFDPVIHAQNYFGRSVTKAARIEPITAPGSIYVSEDFAATLAGSSGNPYTLEYLGYQQLAKGYGATRIYRLDRRVGSAQ